MSALSSHGAITLGGGGNAQSLVRGARSMIEVLEMERRWSGARKVRSKSGQGVAFSGSAVASGAVVVSTRSNWAERGSIGRNCAELSASGFNRVQRGLTGRNGS
jgi:hypothetical protein